MKEKVTAAVVAAILIVTIITLIIWKSYTDYSKPCNQTRYFNYRLVYTLQLNSDLTRIVQLNCTVPCDTQGFQIVQSVNYSITPSWSLVDEHNNTIVRFSVNLIGNKPMNISIVSLIRVNGTNNWEASPLEQYNLVALVSHRYTKPEEYIESDDAQIKQLASNITTGCSDRLNISKALCRWVNSYLNYSGFSSEPRGALWALENGKGDCSEYSHLYIALCRAVDIPARFIDGIVLWTIQGWGFQDWENIGHDWAEIYLPNVGWVWVDPTSNQFGCCDGKHIALQHGQCCKSLQGYYRYHLNVSVDVTEYFEIYQIEG